MIDGTTLAVTATVKVGDRPRGIVLSKDAKSLYICTSDSDHIEELDLASLTVKRVLPCRTTDLVVVGLVGVAFVGGGNGDD